MAAAVGAASLDGVVHADAVVVPRRLPRQGGSEPEILEGICGSSAGAEAVRADAGVAGEVPGLPQCIDGVALDADAGELASGPFPVTPDASSASTAEVHGWGSHWGRNSLGPGQEAQVYPGRTS